MLLFSTNTVLMQVSIITTVGMCLSKPNFERWPLVDIILEGAVKNDADARCSYPTCKQKAPPHPPSPGAPANNSGSEAL